MHLSEQRLRNCLGTTQSATGIVCNTHDRKETKAKKPKQKAINGCVVSLTVVVLLVELLIADGALRTQGSICKSLILCDVTSRNEAFGEFVAYIINFPALSK